MEEGNSPEDSALCFKSSVRYLYEVPPSEAGVLAICSSVGVEMVFGGALVPSWCENQWGPFLACLR